MSAPDFNTLRKTPDLWDTLACETRDIWLYGMGNGADKILAVLEKRGISVTGVFASDGFVRGHAFHGMPVRSFSELCDLYPENRCVVLLSFGTARPEVLALIENVAKRYPLFVPDVPVCGEALFDRTYFLAHEKELLAARELLADDTSKRMFDLTLAYKLTGRLDLLLSATDEARRAELLLDLKIVRRMADFGAYNGDTAREMLSLAPLDFILAAEPDKRNFKKLTAWATTLTNCRIVCHQAAISDTVGEAAFDASGNRNAGLSTGRESRNEAVATATADTLLEEETVDYIKYDVEGAEAAALRGSAGTIARHRPRLKVACYHRSEDLFTLPLLASTLCSDYRFYLTRARSVPAWDLDLLCVPYHK